MLPLVAWLPVHALLRLLHVGVALLLTAAVLHVESGCLVLVLLVSLACLLPGGSICPATPQTGGRDSKDDACRQTA